MVRMARVLDVAVEWLATGEGPMRGSGRTDEETLSAASRELGRPVGPDELPREQFIAWLREWWSEADNDQRVWMKVEISRRFPEYLESIKNLEGGGETRKASA